MKLLIKSGLLFLFILYSALYADGQQTIKMMIKSAEADAEFRGEAELKVDGANIVTGQIVWSIVRIGKPLEIYYRYKMDAKATESVRGSYDPDLKSLNIKGYAKNDLKQIIGLGAYEIKLLANLKMSGEVKGDQNQSATLSGTYEFIGANSQVAGNNSSKNEQNSIYQSLSDLTKPVIRITSPDLQRGAKVINKSKAMRIAGIATDESGILSVVVNGVTASLTEQGNFSVEIPLLEGNNPLVVVVTDKNRNKATTTFIVEQAANATGTVANVMPKEGKFYALLIGVQDYQDPAIQKLDGPIGDVEKLTKVLEQYYTFDPANVTKLKNPTRSQFFEALDVLTEKLTTNDNVIIFYAGHGNWDENRKQGYWYPADAKLSKRDSWITNADLIEYIGSMKAKHTLLISDACFAGSIFKTRAIENATRDIKEMYSLPSRKAMTSGAMKQVPDKSVFIEFLVKRLAENTDEFLSAEQLFSRFKAAVINNSSNGQVPQFGEIRESGDEGGNFIFVKKK